MNTKLLIVAFVLIIAVLIISGTLAISACAILPPVPAALVIEDGGIAVPPSVNRARIEPDGTVVLEYTQ